MLGIATKTGDISAATVPSGTAKIFIINHLTKNDVGEDLRFNALQGKTTNTNIHKSFKNQKGSAFSYVTAQLGGVTPLEYIANCSLRIISPKADCVTATITPISGEF